MAETQFEPFDATGLLQVGVNADHRVAVKLPNGSTKILLFTPFQARQLARLLYRHADRVDRLQGKLVFDWRTL